MQKFILDKGIKVFKEEIQEAESLIFLLQNKQN